MGEYIVYGIGTPFGSHIPYEYKWKVVGSGDVGAGDIAMVQTVTTDPGWPSEWKYRTNYNIAARDDCELWESLDNGETWTQKIATSSGSWDGNSYNVYEFGTYSSYGSSYPSLSSNCYLNHLEENTVTPQDITDMLAGMLNGYAQDIMSPEEWNRYQASFKCCHWTCYKDGTTYYLTWDSPYIENDEHPNNIYPTDVKVKYQYEWKAGAGAVTMSDIYTIAFTSEPIQFNTKGMMEKSSPNKFYTIIAQVTDLFQYMSIDDYLGITFWLEWNEMDTEQHVTITERTDTCWIEFNSQTLAWFFNGNQKDKSISQCVKDYTPIVGDGSTVTLKDGYFADDPDYSGPGDGTDPGYNDPTVPSDVLSSTTPYGNNNILTTTYAMTAPRLASLAAYLWGGVFETTIQKINSSPLENIVSLRCFPFDLSGTDQEIILGNAATGVNGAKVADNYNATFSIGSVTVEGYYGSFLDYEPYTSLKIFLPFIGLKDIDLNYCMGKSLSVEYVVDLATGTGSCNIYVDSVITYTYACNIGFDIPLSSTNSAQVAGNILNNLASSAVVLAAEAASENYVAMAGTLVQAGVKAATAKRSTQTTGSFSANVWGRMPRTCYLVYDRPTYQNISLFNHTYGRMCNQSRVIGTLSGYTQVNNLDLSGIAIMTQEEEDIIRHMFAEGIFV